MTTIGGSAARDRAELGDRDLEVGQHLEQVGLERLVGAVELVDQQHRRRAGCGSSACSSGRRDQEALGEEVLREPLAVDVAPAASARRISIICRAIVPLVGGRGDVQALVALQADQLAAERAAPAPWRSRSCRRPASPSRNSGRLQRQGEEQRGREAAVGDVVARRRAARASRRSSGAAAGVWRIGHENAARSRRRFVERYRLAQRFSAAATARLAITRDQVRRGTRPSRAGRCSGRRAGTLTPAHRLGREASRPAPSPSPATRNTHGPAPVTATRTPPPVSATNTPTSAKREAGLLELHVGGALRAPGSCTAVIISPGCSAVSNRPVKKSSAAIVRWSVVTVAPRPSTAGRVVGRRVGVGERAADACPCCAPAVADAAGELGQRRDAPSAPRPTRRPSAWRGHRADRRRCCRRP